MSNTKVRCLSKKEIAYGKQLLSLRVDMLSKKFGVRAIATIEDLSAKLVDATAQIEALKAEVAALQRSKNINAQELWDLFYEYVDDFGFVDHIKVDLSDVLLDGSFNFERIAEELNKPKK